MFSSLALVAWDSLALLPVLRSLPFFSPHIQRDVALDVPWPASNAWIMHRAHGAKGKARWFGREEQCS